MSRLVAARPGATGRTLPYLPRYLDTWIVLFSIDREEERDGSAGQIPEPKEDRQNLFVFLPGFVLIIMSFPPFPFSQ